MTAGGANERGSGTSFPNHIQAEGYDWSSISKDTPTKLNGVMRKRKETAEKKVKIASNRTKGAVFQQKVTVISRSKPVHAAHRHGIPDRVIVREGQEEYGAQVFITGA